MGSPVVCMRQYLQLCIQLHKKHLIPKIPSHFYPCRILVSMANKRKKRKQLEKQFGRNVCHMTCARLISVDAHNSCFLGSNVMMCM